MPSTSRKSYANGNQRQGPIFKIDNEPRINSHRPDYPARYSLDELPQLWNVLRGEMSLVDRGLIRSTKSIITSWQHYPASGREPGITGCGRLRRRGCPSFELNMHLDLTYIETWTLRLEPAHPGPHGSRAVRAGRSLNFWPRTATAVSSSALTWDQEDKWQWRAARGAASAAAPGLGFSIGALCGRR